jgi:hypothetical protein
MGLKRGKSSGLTGATDSKAGGAGIVPAPSVGQQSRVLSGAGTWVEQNSSSSVSGTVHEVGTIEVGTSAANAASLILGGLEFRWSQAGAAGGVLLINNAPGITQGAANGAAVVRCYTAGNRTESSATTPTLWGADASNFSIGAHVITSSPAGQSLEYDLMTRAAVKPSVWSLKAFWTTSNTLLITGTYIGPKIT